MNADDRYARCEAQILLYEGAFVDNPKDPGGATNQGVTLAELSRFLGHDATVTDLRNMSPELVAGIYRRDYWQAIKGDQLRAGVDLVAFNAAVNCGPGHAAKWLQVAVGAAQDGAIGPATLAALARANDNTVIGVFCAAQEGYYRALATFPTFGKGWISRLKVCKAKALSWVTA